MPRPRTVDDEQILIAAARAVGEVGPGRLTLADVGRQIGLSPATLLQRFGSKRGLLLALAARGVDTMPARIRDAADAAAVLPALTDVLVEFTSSVEQPAQFANHLSFLLMDLADPDFQVLSRRYVESLVAALQDVVEVAVARGELPAGTDVPALAQLIHTSYNGALLGWGMAPVGVPADAVRSRVGYALHLATTGAAPRAARRGSRAR